MADTTEWDIEKIEQTFHGTASNWGELTPQDLLSIRQVLDDRSLNEKFKDNDNKAESLWSYLDTIVKDKLETISPEEISSKEDLEAYLRLTTAFSSKNIDGSIVDKGLEEVRRKIENRLKSLDNQSEENTTPQNKGAQNGGETTAYEQAMEMVQRINNGEDTEIGIEDLQAIHKAFNEHKNHETSNSGSDAGEHATDSALLADATIGRITHLFNNMPVLDYNELTQYKNLLESVAKDSEIYKQINALIENNQKLEELKKNKENYEKQLETHLQGVYVSEHPDEDVGQATWESPEYKVWAGQYSDAETVRLRAQITNTTNQIVQLENQQKSLMPQSQHKAAPQQDQNGRKTPITKDNVFEHAQKEDLSKWTATEMHTLLTTLNSGRQTFNAVTYNEEAREALRAKLEKAVVKFSQDFNDNKLVILNMDDAYLWQDVVKSCAEHPESEYGKENVEAVEKAKEKVADQITGFEEEFGLNAKQTPEQIAQNLETLEKLPSTEKLFAHKTPEYPVLAATEYHEIKEIVSTYKQNKSIPKLSVLVGALQNNYLSQEYDGIKETLEQWAVELIKQTTKLENPEDIGNFEKLLSLIPLEENEGLIESKRQLVTTAKEVYEQTQPLVHPELQEAYDLLNALEIQGEMQTFGRKKLSKEEQQDQKDMIVQRVRAETETYLANVYPITNEDGTKQELTPEVFYQEFSGRLNLSIMEIVYADQISKGNVSKKEIEKNLSEYINRVLPSSKGGSIKINTMSLAGWHAARDGKHHCAIKKSEEKHPEGKNLFAKIKTELNNLDEKCTKKYGAAYSMTKGALKSLGWGAAYSVAGLAGPAGIAAVATLSFANQARGMYADFRNQRDKLAAQGQKLTFGSYLKDNKLRAAGVLLSATAVVTGGLSAAEFLNNPVVQKAVNYARFGSALALGAATAAHQANQAYKKSEGSRWQKFKAASKAFGVSAASFGLGFLAGRAGGEAAGGAFSDDSIAQGTQLSSVSQDEINTPAYSDDNLRFGYKSTFSQFLGQDGAEASDATPPLAPEPPAPKAAEIDPNNLNQEQQYDIDMLFKRAPADANEILGDGEWHSSAELQKMWENGDISQEKMQELLDHGAKTFDDKGLFIDADGKIDQAREQDAQEWQRQHDAASKPDPEPASFTPEQKASVLTGIDLSELSGKISSPLPDELNLYHGEASNATPSAEPQNQEGIDVTKVKTDKDGDVKIVYRDEEGHRHVHHTDSSTLDTEGVSKVKFDGDNAMRSAAEDVVAASIAENHGLEGAEKTTLTRTDGTEIEILKGNNGWARVDESGVDTLVKNEDGSYTFSTGAGEQAKPMTYEDAKEFTNELEATNGINSWDRAKALYQNYPEEYTDNVADRLGLGGKITHETAQTGVTTFVGENGVGIMAENGEAVAAFLDQEGKLQLVSSSLGQEPKEITNPHLIDNLKQIAAENDNSEIVEAIAAKQAEAQQPVGNDGQTGADNATPADPNAEGKSPESEKVDGADKVANGGKEVRDQIMNLRGGRNPNLEESSDNNRIPPKDHSQTRVPPQQVQAMQSRMGHGK